MIVEPMAPGDRQRVALIARLAHQDIDLEAEAARAWGRLSVARETPGGDAVGLLLVWLVSDELHVINVATHPDFRRRGVARALLGAELALAARDQLRLVLLEVRRSNRAAIQLYRSLGFSTRAVRKSYYADNGEDAIEMQLSIDPQSGRFLPGTDEVELD